MPRFILALLSFLAVAPLASAQDRECETSCSARCVQLVNEYDHIVQAHRDYCGGGNVNCVLNCTSRYADGSCRQYGADFCGRNPVCAKNCSSRYADGSCRTYAADSCGEAPLNCVANCTSRYADGSCRAYGADVCGRNASCRPNCTSRYPDGSCREYGPDVCRP